MKIIVLDGHTLSPGDLSWEDLERLGELTVYDRTDPADIAERAGNAAILMTNKVPISSETITLLPRLQFISVLATGYDMVDIAAAGKRGIPVSNVPEYGTDAVAQFTMAALLELCHRIGLHDAAVKEGDWSASPDWCFWKTPQISLRGKTIGIVGLGRIGRRVGELAHAFGMEVLAFDPQPGEAPGYSGFRWRSLEGVFSEADVVTLHCPQTPDNVGFVDSRLLKRMKKEALFLNAARGGLVNEKDLASALNSEAISGAAVDVVSEEPIRPDNPLLTARNCLITPHMAWAARKARQRLMMVTVQNVEAFLNGSPLHVVNEEHLTARTSP